jgi:type III restriction enzyme
VVLDSDWERQLAQALEELEEVHAYAKNHHLDFHIPYTFEGHERHYLVDFIVRVDDGHGPADQINLIVAVRALGVRGSERPV